MGILVSCNKFYPKKKKPWDNFDGEKHVSITRRKEEKLEEGNTRGGEPPLLLYSCLMQPEKSNGPETFFKMRKTENRRNSFFLSQEKAFSLGRKKE